MNQERMLTVRAVEELTGYSRSSIYALAADGKFPKPVKLGSHEDGPRHVASRWLLSEVNAWIAAHREARDKTGEAQPHQMAAAA